MVSPLGNPLGSDYQVVLAASDKTNISNLRKVECMLQLIMGLQNDILGEPRSFSVRLRIITDA